MPDELRLFVPAAVKVVLGRLAPMIEEAAGGPVGQVVDLNPAIPERIAAGEPFDIALTNPPYVAALIAGGHADAASHRAFGRVPLAVARRAGAEAPVARAPAEIAALFRAAQSIGSTGAGTSGRIYLEVLERLGLSDVVAPRSRAMSGGGPAEAVARGEIDLAVAPLTTVLATPGVVPAAILPGAMGTDIDMSGVLRPGSGAGAARVLDLLTGPSLDGVLAEAGIGRFALA